ncbi:MAG: pyridoxal 5'-phosphate synthase glutaminase subunit PdxT [Parachlamydiaceae bacterium]
MATRQLRVGVLALQGAFAMHLAMLARLGVQAIEVRKPEDLDACDALIIPGGESTVIFKQMRFINFIEPLLDFAKSKPLFGTCAGLILMSNTVVGEKTVEPLNLLNVSIERNAFGRQAESFETDIDFLADTKHRVSIPATFIRAPRIRHVGEGVKVLATFNDEPVLVQQGLHLGAAFHPELTNDPILHLYFLERLK